MTGIHGLSYTVTGRNRLETFFWIVAVIVSISWALINCYNSFLELSANPVIVNIETFEYDASKVPYPTLTFCPT